MPIPRLGRRTNAVSQDSHEMHDVSRQTGAGQQGQRLSTHLSKERAAIVYNNIRQRLDTEVRGRPNCIMECEVGINATDRHARDEGRNDDDIEDRVQIPLLVTNRNNMRKAATNPKALEEEAEAGLRYIEEIVLSRASSAMRAEDDGRPSLIISVTGGARAFDLSDSMVDSIEDGLRRAADSTDAWIITGGTNVGVMKVTGDVMSNINLGRDHAVPVIGIATFGTLDDSLRKQALAGKHFTFRQGGYKTLNGGHNAFILVDDGSEGKYGREISYRAEFEKQAAARYKCPAVLVVIQGGPGTLGTALQAIRRNTPVVTVRGTGLVADLLAEAWDFTHSGSVAARGSSIDGLLRSFRRSFPDMSEDEIKERVKEALECVQDRTKFVVCNFGDGTTLDQSILQAAFTGSSAELENRLNLAVYFRNAKQGAKLLASFTKADNSPEDVKKFDAALPQALFTALKLRDYKFVDMLLKHGAKVHDILPQDTMANTTLAPFFAAVSELYNVVYREPNNHLGRLINAPKHVALKQEDEEQVDTRHIERIVSSLVDRDFVIQRSYTKEGFENAKNKKSMAYHTLMIWAVVINDFALAKIFWERCEEHIPNALVASRILSAMSEASFTSGTTLVELRLKMTENSRKFSDLALGLLDVCQASDPLSTAYLLLAPLKMFQGSDEKNRPPKATIDVAYDAWSQAFLAHTSTRAIVNRNWYGNLSPRNSAVKMVLCVLLPFLAIFWPTLVKEDEDKHAKPHRITSKAIQDLEYSVREERKVLNCGWKFWVFFQAPFTRYIIDVLSHIGLCLMFSWMLLDRFEDTFSTLEIVLAAWFGSLVLEELRQLKLARGVSGFSNWARDPWNIIDACFLSVYIAGLGTRVADLKSIDNKIAAKNVYGAAAILLWIRLARFYVVSAQLGPKLVMIQRMMGDVLSFVMLLIVCLFGFSVAGYTSLFPDTDFSRHSVGRALFRPVFNVFGEPLLEDLRDDAACFQTPFNACNKGAFMSAVYLALFMLISNVLLLNLLIAMFNNTYQEVEERAHQLWCTQNYELLLEYQDKPLLPAPLIVIEHVYLLLLSSCSKRHYHQETDKQRQKHIQAFQKTCIRRYLDKEKQNREQTDSSRLEKLTNHIDKMAYTVLQLEDSVLHLRAAAQLPVKGSLSGEVDLDALTGGGEVIIHSQSVFPNDSGSESPVYGFEPGSETRSRETHATFFVPFQFEGKYPQSDVLRGQVPVQDWKNPCEYKPRDYTASVVLGAAWADPENPQECTFNVPFDGKGIIRFSAAASRLGMTNGYAIDAKGRPMNPYGRTGISGRGKLGKWGVNFAIDTVVTRWRKDDNGAPLERQGKGVLEFIAIRRKDTGGWATPGGFVQPHESFDQAHVREFAEEAMNSLEKCTKLSDQDKKDIESFIQKKQKLVYEGYAEDQRNTDNAWIETHVVNCHDENHDLHIELEGGDDASDARWLMVHRALRLFAGQERYLKAIARMHDAYW